MDKWNRQPIIGMDLNNDGLEQECSALGMDLVNREY